MLPWILIGWPIAAVAIAFPLAKVMAEGMGSKDAETVCQAFDKAQRAYLDACKRHNGQADAWKALRAAQTARLRAEVSK